MHHSISAEPSPTKSVTGSVSTTPSRVDALDRETTSAILLLSLPPRPDALLDVTLALLQALTLSVSFRAISCPYFRR